MMTADTNTVMNAQNFFFLRMKAYADSDMLWPSFAEIPRVTSKQSVRITSESVANGLPIYHVPDP